MIKSTQIISLFILLSTCFSCVSYKYSTKDYDKSKKRNIGVIKPISIIGLIEEKNIAKYDSSYSNKTTTQLLQETIEMTGSNNSCKEIQTDTSVRNKIYKEIFELSSKLSKAHGKQERLLVVNSYKMSDVLYGLLNDNNLDQLIISYHKGFTRTKSNYKNQNWKSLGVGLLTLGTYIPIPVKSNSIIYTWILDKEGKTLIFSNMSFREIEPIETAEFSKQICELYAGLFTVKTDTGACYHQ